MSSAESTQAVSPPRFGLKSLFVLLTVAAILLGPVHWFGGIYLVSAGFSFALVACCVFVYGRERRRAALIIAILGAMISVPLAMGIIVFALHAILNAVLCVPLIAVRPRLRAFVITLVGLMVGVYGYVFWQAGAELRKLHVLKASHPFESMATRLEFEHQTSPVESTSHEPIHLAAGVVANLDDLEGQRGNSYFSRAWALRELHENTYRHFARAAGFGVSRMPPLRYMFAEWDERPPLELPYSVALSKRRTNGSELYAVHRDAVVDFASADRTGYVRSRNAVAGFQPHRLNATEDGYCADAARKEKWQVVRLELVSLLRHDVPCVYVADNMPPMDQLADVPHRALNDFERRALPQLDSQKDIVFNQQPGEIFMLGAVRAAKRCLKCHEGTRGKLLGAFSYEITPVASPEQPKSDSVPSAQARVVAN